MAIYHQLSLNNKGGRYLSDQIICVYVLCPTELRQKPLHLKFIIILVIILITIIIIIIIIIMSSLHYKIPTE